MKYAVQMLNGASSAMAILGVMETAYGDKLGGKLSFCVCALMSMWALQLQQHAKVRSG